MDGDVKMVGGAETAGDVDWDGDTFMPDAL
jgi:hypothetical protein